MPPRSAATRRTRSMILVCPRCSPSKLPSASTGWCQRGGRGSSGKRATSIRDGRSCSARAGAVDDGSKVAVRGSAGRRVHVERQAVVGELHAGRERRVGGRVRQVVADVREERAPRLDARRRPRAPRATVKCVGCGRWRSASSTRTSSPSSSGHDSSGNAVAVGEVGERAEAKAEDRPRAVEDRHRHDAQRRRRSNGPSIVCRSICGTPPPFCSGGVEDVAETCGAGPPRSARRHRRESRRPASR